MLSLSGLCLVNATVQRICKNRIKGINAFEQNESRIKRFRKPERSDVNEALLRLFSNKDLTMYQ